MRYKSDSNFTIIGSGGLSSTDPQPSYSNGTIQPIDEELSHHPPVVEPHRIYQLAEGHLIMSRDCDTDDEAYSLPRGLVN